ncbi:PREDICTED: uncharacterized protein LOC104607256 [Nelumbo nucifera]|uniref:Uncharacterized protein LOC104607256 n=1 Tax=Nelumbo nucifera TaxID=4432 RepID=A0A1U8AT26_NELNU|nr:PREDICTED: uncharacterized protein LOC104607256 [Nelumbo nucifera]
MDDADEGETPAGVVVDEKDREKLGFIEIEKMGDQHEETLYGVLHRLLADIFFPGSSAPASLLERTRASFRDNGPLLREASRNSSRNLLLWTRQGSPLCALLVIPVGTIVFLALTGLLVFMLFFLAATFNAIIISLLMSLAAVGGFLALFFACMTAIYIGALSIAACVISTAAISAIFAVVIATGWIGFLWTVWLATKKTVGLAKHSFCITGSALSAYSAARQVHHHRTNKVD